jgi:hypothetical protein
MKTFWKLSLLACLGTLSLQAVGWYKTPQAPLEKAWGLKLERRIGGLPDHGRVDSKHTPWVNHVWDSKKGGIAYRWSNPDQSDSFTYRTFKREQLLKMKPEARFEIIKNLSPAEKFDLLRGRYDYPLVQAERKRTYRLKDTQDNLALGWAIAATHLQEPGAITRKNRDGIEIPFASSDIKALTSFYYSQKAGKNLKTWKAGITQAIDPATFHIILANMTGLYERPFIGNIVRSDLPDHRPIVGFDSDIRFESTGLYRVRTTIEYSRIRAPQWQPYEFYNLDTDREVFEYTLEVNTKDEIVRGNWTSAVRPQFVWRSNLPALDLDFEELRDLYQSVSLN